jgi:NAD-binding of NADP-dependent 3-hydroxyisobutyrate dehydrogenase
MRGSGCFGSVPGVPAVGRGPVPEGVSRGIEGVAEALELASHLGIDAAGLAEPIEGGPLDAPIADAKLHKIQSGDFAPEFPLEWALKDVDLAIAAADDDRLPLLEALSGSGARPSRLATAGTISAPHAWPWAIRVRARPPGRSGAWRAATT